MTTRRQRLLKGSQKPLAAAIRFWDAAAFDGRQMLLGSSLKRLAAATCFWEAPRSLRQPPKASGYSNRKLLSSSAFQRKARAPGCVRRGSGNSQTKKHQERHQQLSEAPTSNGSAVACSNFGRMQKYSKLWQGLELTTKHLSHAYR